MDTNTNTLIDTIDNSNNESRCWSITNDTIIPQIPLFYPIEKTHTVISEQPSPSPSIIVSRISNFLKLHSISCIPLDNKCSVKAQTSNHVQFIIRLYSISNSSSNPDIMVEIQRVSGCAITFHSTCKKALGAARGDNDSNTGIANDKQLNNDNIDKKPNSINRPKSINRPNKSINKPKFSRSNKPKSLSSSTKSSTSTSFQMNIQERIQESLEIVDSLLKKDRIDANLLGIESLRMLTNVDISGLDTAIVAANVVLNHDGHFTIKEKIQSLVQHWRLCDDDEHNEENDVFDQKHNNQMRNHALNILANSLHVLSTQNTLCIKEDSWLSTTFISALVLELKESNSRPHDGAISAKCLNMLIRQSDKIRQSALDQGVNDILWDTLCYSRCANNVLAKESELAYSALNCK